MSRRSGRGESGDIVVLYCSDSAKSNKPPSAGSSIVLALGIVSSHGRHRIWNNGARGGQTKTLKRGTRGHGVEPPALVLLAKLTPNSVVRPPRTAAHWMHSRRMPQIFASCRRAATGHVCPLLDSALSSGGAQFLQQGCIASTLCPTRWGYYSSVPRPIPDQSHLPWRKESRKPERKHQRRNRDPILVTLGESR